MVKGYQHSLRNFNSQPHEEADDHEELHRGTSGFISTHSLTKRLTILGIYFYVNLYISTHSLTKRLTANGQMLESEERYFNSQPHEEADIINSGGMESWSHFNSQPHEEADGAFLQKRGKRRISTHSLTKRLTSALASL